MLILPLLLVSCLVAGDGDAYLQRRINTALALLPAIYKMEMAGITFNSTFDYVNDSVTENYLVHALPFIDDRVFSPVPTTMRETIANAASFINSTIATDVFATERFTYEKLFAVLVGSFRGMLHEIKTIMKQGNEIDIK